MAQRPSTPPDAGPDTFAAAAGTPAAPNPFAAGATQGANTPTRPPTLLRRLGRTGAAALLGVAVLALLV